MGASKIEKYLQSRRNLTFIALKTSTTCLRLALETVSLFFCDKRDPTTLKEILGNITKCRAISEKVEQSVRS